MTYMAVNQRESPDDLLRGEDLITPIDVQEIDRSSEPSNDDKEHSVMMGAAAAGGCIGCMVGGPFLACIVGVASAYGTTKESAAGDCARCMGHLALSCHNKAKQLNDKHHIVDKTKAAAQVCWEKSKDTSERHRLVQRTKGCLASTWEGVKDANVKHRITDRTFEAIGYACTFVNEQVIAGGHAHANVEPQTASGVEVNRSASECSNSGDASLPSKVARP